jgi:ATP-dependent protease ClpP protease subunit
MENTLKTINHIDKLVATIGQEQPIVVQIESYGGSVAGLSILYNKLITLNNPIITYCTSTAMSAGLFLLSSVTSKPNRIIAPTAKLMIHEIQGMEAGDIKDVNAQNRHLNELNDTWVGILAKAVGMRDMTELRAFMRAKTTSHNLYMNAKEAVEWGFADMVGNVVISPPLVGFDIKMIPPKVEKPIKPIKRKK